MKSFDFNQIAPFDLLSASEQQQLAQGADIVYLPLNQTLHINTDQPDQRYLLIILKGRAQWTVTDQPISEIIHPDETAGASLLIQGGSGVFLALEEVLAYRITGQLFDQLCQHNPAFLAYWTNGIRAKLATLKRQAQASAFADFMTIHTGDVQLSPLIHLNDTDSLHQASQQLRQQHSTAALVVTSDNQHPLGIVTRTDLLNAFTDYPADAYPKLSDIANKQLLCIDADDYLFNALLAMTEHNVSHLVVQRHQQPIGILQQKTLLGAFANQSMLIGQQLEQATQLTDLVRINETILTLIRSLHQKGVKARFIAELVSTLNRALIRKVSQLTAPAQLNDQLVAVIIMGSEGRQEQILRTDQDNALIWQGDINPTDMQTWATSMHDALAQLGFPDCPGNIMMTNPLWQQPLTQLIRQLQHWTQHPTPEHMMHLSILLDADTASGNPQLTESLVKQAKQHIASHHAFMGHFAKSALQFETPLGLFAQFITNKNHQLDIKKGGIFPIVHGARVLMCEQSSPAKTTHARLAVLGDQTRLMDAGFASELSEALDFMQQLRLTHQLTEHAQQQTITNLITPDHLTHLQRDLLKDCFKLVDAFKTLLTHHYKLNHLI